MSRCSTTTKEIGHSCFAFLIKRTKPNPTMHIAKTALSSSSSSNIGNVLLVAFLTKTLSESGTRNLDPASFPVSETLVLKILRKGSLETYKKMDFFKWCSLRHNYKHSARTYSQMFRTLCSSGCLEEVAGLLKSMKEDGVVVDPRTFKVLLDNFLLSGKFDFALDLLDYMEELGANLDTQMYNSVIFALARKDQVALALSIFMKLMEASDPKEEGNVDVNVATVSLPSSVASNALLAALRKADMRIEFKQVFIKLRESKGFVFDTWGYNICIHAFGCWGELGTSFMLFKEMKEKSLQSGSFGPDLCTYNSLIRVLCLVGRVKKALILYRELKVSGLDPDAFTYQIFIHGCCKSYRMNDAMNFLSEMQHNGFLPSTTVYNTLLDGMLKARKVKEACELYAKMVQDGVRASCWTYNILIDGLFRNGRVEAGYTLFCELKKKGQFVDAVSYSIVVLQLCREGQLEKALHLVEEMEERGLPVDLVTVTSLIVGFHKQGRWDWTERLIKHIRDSNLVSSVLKWKADMETYLKSPSSRAKDYTPMFPSIGNLRWIVSLMRSPVRKNHDSSDGGVKSGKCSQTETDQWSSSVFMDHSANEVNSQDHYVLPFSSLRGQRVQAKGAESFDIDMVNTFLSIFLAKGKLSIACKLFEILSDRGVNPVSYTYNSIISSLVKKDYVNEAWNALNEMGEKVGPADVATYNVIIQGLGKMGRADLASSVLDKLVKQGGYLDVVMYNTLINALGKAGRIDEANKLFEQMKNSGINADVVTYNTLIEVHTKAGRLKDAYNFLKMMLDAGCLPNHVTDTTLDALAREIEKLRYQKASIVRQRDDSC